MTQVLILGGTGLVGQQLIAQALANPAISNVVAPTRRPLPPNSKLVNPLIDYDHLPENAGWWNADAVLCALGTTIHIAGTKSAFYQVDHDYVYAAAQLAKQAGSSNFIYNSSLGANPKAGSFYLRVKGEIERDLGTIGFASLCIVRPSLLSGGPRPDNRPGEIMALYFSRLFQFCIPKRYQPVSVAEVAHCMLAAALHPTPGIHIIESDQLHPASA